MTGPRFENFLSSVSVHILTRVRSIETVDFLER